MKKLAIILSFLFLLMLLASRAGYPPGNSGAVQARLSDHFVNNPTNFWPATFTDPEFTNQLNIWLSDFFTNGGGGGPIPQNLTKTNDSRPLSYTNSGNIYDGTFSGNTVGLSNVAVTSLYIDPWGHSFVTNSGSFFLADTNSGEIGLFYGVSPAFSGVFMEDELNDIVVMNNHSFALQNGLILLGNIFNATNLPVTGGLNTNRGFEQWVVTITNGAAAWEPNAGGGAALLKWIPTNLMVGINITNATTVFYGTSTNGFMNTSIFTTFTNGAPSLTLSSYFLNSQWFAFTNGASAFALSSFYTISQANAAISASVSAALVNTNNVTFGTGTFTNFTANNFSANTVTLSNVTVFGEWMFTTSSISFTPPAAIPSVLILWPSNALAGNITLWDVTIGGTNKIP